MYLESQPPTDSPTSQSLPASTSSEMVVENSQDESDNKSIIDDDVNENSERSTLSNFLQVLRKKDAKPTLRYGFSYRAALLAITRSMIRMKIEKLGSLFSENESLQKSVDPEFTNMKHDYLDKFNGVRPKDDPSRGKEYVRVHIKKLFRKTNTKPILALLAKKIYDLRFVGTVDNSNFEACVGRNIVSLINNNFGAESVTDSENWTTLPLALPQYLTEELDKGNAKTLEDEEKEVQDKLPANLTSFQYNHLLEKTCKDRNRLQERMKFLKGEIENFTSRRDNVAKQIRKVTRKRDLAKLHEEVAEINIALFGESTEGFAAANKILTMLSDSKCNDDLIPEIFALLKHASGKETEDGEVGETSSSMHTDCPSEKQKTLAVDAATRNNRKEVNQATIPQESDDATTDGDHLLNNPQRSDLSVFNLQANQVTMPVGTNNTGNRLSFVMQTLRTGSSANTNPS